MAAYGLYSHIQSNRRRSIALLIGLFFLVYLLVFAGALLAEALTTDAPIDYLVRAALYDLTKSFPFATIGTIVWILIAYKFHQSMIDAMTSGHEVTRTEGPKLYNLLENLCISRGITMPKLKVADDDALNAFATGLNEKQYSITVTRGLMNALNDAELEAVLGHELTHIRNGDVRMLVIAVVIAGAISFFGEMVFRLFFQSAFYGGFRRRGGGSDRKGGAGLAIVIAVALIVVAWILSIVIRFALSRQREYLADAGSVELTKNPDAMSRRCARSRGAENLSAPIPRSWKCASTIRVRVLPICSLLTLPWIPASRPWSNIRVATIQARSRWMFRQSLGSFQRRRKTVHGDLVTNPNRPAIRSVLASHQPA